MKNSRVEWNDKPYTNKKHHLPSLFHGFSIWRYVLFDNNNNLMNFTHFERPIINKWLFDDIFFCGRLSMDICYIVLKDVWSVYDLKHVKIIDSKYIQFNSQNNYIFTVPFSSFFTDILTPLWVLYHIFSSSIVVGSSWSRVSGRWQIMMVDKKHMILKTTPGPQLT